MNLPSPPPLFWTWLGLALVAGAVGWLAIGAWRAIRYRQGEARELARESARLAAELAALRETRPKRATEAVSWNGFRKFLVKQKIEEGAQVYSFLLVPHDAKPLPPFKPGQHLVFRLSAAGRESQLIRCYSLSDHPHQPHYRVTIKRALPPPDQSQAAAGVGSSLFHDHVKEDDILDVRAPTGSFHLDPQDAAPLVLIGGGIGLTPLYSMLATLVHQRSRREVWLYYGVRHRGEHLFREQLTAIARDHPNIRVRICYSQPGPADRAGEDYHVPGRITVDLLRRELPSNDFVFYYCGPWPMMEALTAGLKAWGVPDSRLHFEAFGPLNVKRGQYALGGTPGAAVVKHQVNFRKSGIAVSWDASCGTLLDLAEQAGISIASGCRTGNCGTCLLAVPEGEVAYIQPPGTLLEPRTCLSCIAQPKGALVVDA